MMRALMTRRGLARRATGAAWAAMAVLLAGTGGWAQGETAGAPASVRRVVARRDANFVRVDGKPTVLLWARELEEAADLEQYAALGMNTAYVLIRGSSEEELANASLLASAAEARGLMVVGGLAPRALVDAEGNELAIDPLSGEYAAAVSAFVKRAAETLGEHVRLVAWSVEAVAPNRVVWGDAGFIAYLQDWYGSVAGVNASWGTGFGGWEEIRAAAVWDIDTTRPGGLGRASVDFGYYRGACYADTLALWAEALREADPGRLVFASALTDYRSIISVGMDFDGLVLNTYPSLAEFDRQTHNVHAVDIGRRANRFAVVQTLEVGPETRAGDVTAWAAMALQHGAGGIAFSSWGAVRDSEALRGTVEGIADGLGEVAAFPAEPMPRAAIIYEPLAGGTMRDGRGLYGYLDGFAPKEPSALFAIGRNGSRYGQFDVLSLDSVTEVSLSQYGVIIAPMAMYLPLEAQQALHNYVMGGGTLMADAGIGMYQGAGVVTSLPVTMRETFGMRSDLAVAEAWSAPTGGELQMGEAGGFGTPLTEAPQASGLAYNEDLGRLSAIVDQVLGRPQVAEYLGMGFLADDAPRVQVNALGRGYAVYLPMFLYQDLEASNPYFVELHARVLRQGANLEVLEPQGVWPGVSAGMYRGWSVGLASPYGAAASVAVYGGGNQVYAVPAGGMRLGTPGEGDWVELLFPGALVAVAEPVPIYVRPVEAGQVATVSVVAYDADRIELMVHGTGAQARAERGGIAVSGGTRTAVAIEVADGSYGIARGSIHRVVVTEGARERVIWEQEMMPDPETGTLVIQGLFGWARVTVEPAEGQG